MALSAPPPRRSRRERRRLPSKRLVLSSGLVVVLVGLLVWQPWAGPKRRQWTTAPAVPAAPTVAESRWVGRLGGWVSFVRDAEEDPTAQAVLDCKPRLRAIGATPARLQDVGSLAADACSAYGAQSRDTISSRRAVDAKLAGRAIDEGREARHDMGLLISSLNLRTPPGGHVVARYSQIASRLAGRLVSARCWDDEANWADVGRSSQRSDKHVLALDGFAMWWLGRIELSPGVCRTLDRIVRRPGAARVDEIVAIEVLTHESEHLVGPDGISNEARTDCYAAQRLGTTARLLGVPAARADAMGPIYLALFQQRLPAQYLSSNCRSGGAYDLTPGDGRWP